MAKIRADQRLVQLGLADSRARAHALVLAGKVLLNGDRVAKPGTGVASDARLELVAPDRYVSRGGHKLEGALKQLELNVTESVCLDLGASTGGFTDCLLQHGAKSVDAVDVGNGLLHERLQRDPRVRVLDRTNARSLRLEQLSGPPDLTLIDVSFISIEKLLPALALLVPGGGKLLAMVKPQFEVGREVASKSRGVVRDPEQRDPAIAKVVAQIEQAGFVILGRCDSVLTGPKGNVEHFVLAQRLPLEPATS